MFGEFGVGLFAQAGWISQEQELGAEHSGRRFRAYQNFLWQQTPRSPHAVRSKTPPKPQGEAWICRCIRWNSAHKMHLKRHGLSHTGKLCSRMALLEGIYNNHLAQVPTAFFDRSIHVAEITHTVLLPAISWADKQQPK